MHSMTAFLGTLTIPSGQTDSNILVSEQGKLTTGINFVNPAAFTGVVDVYVALNDAGTPLAVGTQLTAATVQEVAISGAKQIQVKSGSAEGSDRVIQVYVVFLMGGISDV